VRGSGAVKGGDGNPVEKSDGGGGWQGLLDSR